LLSSSSWIDEIGGCNMAVHVNGVYVVGGKSNEKGNIIRIHSYEHGYYYYYTIKGKICGADRFAKDSMFEKNLVHYGCDYPIKLKGNEEEDNMDEKIVVLRNGKAVTATKYMNGKMVNSATAKCHPDDKFNFNVGAKIAVGRLVRENNNTDRKALDKTLGEAKEELNQKLKKFREELCYTLDFISCSWDYFKKGKSQVKVTSENIESFLRVAEDKRIKWYNGGNAMESVEVLKRRFSTTSEIYISYNNGMRFSISQSKNRVVVDWDKILPLFPKKIVYSNDFSWDGFLNGEVTVQMSKEDSVYFFWQFCFAKLTSYFSGIEKEFYDFKDYNPFMNFVFTLNKNDSIWCKMKDGKLVFCKAYGLSPIIPLYKYNGKKI
jgi:hypothetical protein